MNTLLTHKPTTTRHILDWIHVNSETIDKMEVAMTGNGIKGYLVVFPCTMVDHLLQPLVAEGVNLQVSQDYVGKDGEYFTLRGHGVDFWVFRPWS